jgi:hypothetical protein
MKCYHSELNIFCDFIDTAGMDKTVPCEKCPHYSGIALNFAKKPGREIAKKPESLYQAVHWDESHGIRLIFGNPAKSPAAFHLIYKWSLHIGKLEIRKFLTEKEMHKALKIYNDIKL